MVRPDVTSTSSRSPKGASSVTTIRSMQGSSGLDTVEATPIRTCSLSSTSWVSSGFPLQD
jgi:hypothetical protein